MPWPPQGLQYPHPLEHRGSRSQAEMPQTHTAPAGSKGRHSAGQHLGQGGGATVHTNPACECGIMAGGPLPSFSAPSLAQGIQKFPWAPYTKQRTMPRTRSWVAIRLLTDWTHKFGSCWTVAGSQSLLPSPGPSPCFSNTLKQPCSPISQVRTEASPRKMATTPITQPRGATLPLPRSPMSPSPRHSSRPSF